MGILSNEKADLMGNEAITSQSSVKINLIIFSKAIDNIKNEIIETWLNSWINLVHLNYEMNIT